MVGVEQQLPADQLGIVIEQGGGVLQLIAIAKSAARLIERRAAPQPANQGLISQPAVDHQIDRRRGSLDMHRSQPIPPEGSHLGQGRRRHADRPVAFEQAAGLRAIIRFAQ